ncbi:OLC1v1012273C4 [Oldenlandia corymbosa var. corymbosa]|uniref:OLC1v1012273C4 n=1 Tax=Oldenlandia corymbosa var. corymbosa TaxID=529605 RepID=A0AAV1DYT0_OLDCO|nr:OLC1v1012273C4 [Oldenlandia corymbosa var. corymbosa]
MATNGIYNNNNNVTILTILQCVRDPPKAGIILGSTLLGERLEYQKFLFPASGQGILGSFASFGYLFFQFLSGVKMDTGMIRKTGPKALAIGVINIAAPILFGVLLDPLIVGVSSGKPSYSAKKMKDNRRAVFVAHSMTAFPVVAFLLKDLKILNSELGRLALSSGLISHLLQALLTSINTIYNGIVYKGRDIFSDVTLCTCFVLFIFFAIRPALVWMVKQTPEGRPVQDLYIYLVIFAVIASAIFSLFVDINMLVGPFLIGLAVPEGPPLGSALVDKLEAFSSGVLLPTFITVVTLRTNISDISGNIDTFSVLLILIAFVTKIAATFLCAWYCKMPVRDALALGLILSTKGVVDLATYSFVRDLGFINQPIFALLVLATAAIGTFVPFMVQLLYDPTKKYAGYQKRSIMYSRLGGKLPILACIHSSDNIMATMRLLDACTPTTESPITVNALHLIELRGRATPIFISHKAQGKSDSSSSYSEDVILSFKQFERNNWGAVTAQAFTAISPRKLMQEDICTLALDVLASIIIVPFHRRWGIDGSVESEDMSLRTLNRNVLDRAPCSVGVLIDRGHLGRSNSMTSSAKTYHVAMIFLGGRDDQEALTLAKRMTRNGNINLTIIRCVPKGIDGANMEDDVSDIKVLYDFKQNRIGQGNVTYIEKIVNDPPELAWLVRSMADQFDLILVGRRYKVESVLTVGFEEWCEVPELGIIGDLLATSDLRRRASVLIVQQQKIIH